MDNKWKIENYTTSSMIVAITNELIKKQEQEKEKKNDLYYW